MAGRSSDKEPFWRTLLAKYDSRRETIRDFCQRAGVSEQSFYWWRRKLHPAAIPSNPVFQPVAVVAEPTPVAAAIELRLRGGQRVRIRPGFDAATLRQLLDVLEATAQPGQSAC